MREKAEEIREEQQGEWQQWLQLLLQSQFLTFVNVNTGNVGRRMLLLLHNG